MKKAKKFVITILIFISLFTSILLNCCTNPTKSTKDNIDQKAKVFGYVFNKSTNEPMVSVFVLIEDKQSKTMHNGYYEFNDMYTGQKVLMAMLDTNYWGADIKFHTFKDTINIVSGDNQFDIYLTPDHN